MRRSCSVRTSPTSARRSSSCSRRNAARQVADADELTRGLLADLDDPEAAAARGAAGRDFVLAQNGAAGRTLAELDRLVESSLASHIRLTTGLRFVRRIR